jgi:hypothetical protein
MKKKGKKKKKKKKLVDFEGPPRKCAYQAFIIQNLDVEDSQDHGITFWTY